MSSKKIPDNQIAVYQTPDGSVNIEVLYADENIWLSQKRMAELFGCSPDNISLHLRNIYREKELDAATTAEEFAVVQKEGNREISRVVTCYSLEAIIAVGYRVNSALASSSASGRFASCNSTSTRALLLIVTGSNTGQGSVLASLTNCWRRFAGERGGKQPRTAAKKKCQLVPLAPLGGGSPERSRARVKRLPR